MLANSGWVINANAPKEQIDKAQIDRLLVWWKECWNISNRSRRQDIYKSILIQKAGIKWLIQIYGEMPIQTSLICYSNDGIQVFTVQTKWDILTQPGTFPKCINKLIRLKMNLGGLRPYVPESSLILLKNQKSYLNWSWIKHILWLKNIIKFIEGQRDVSEWDHSLKKLKIKT